MSQPIEPQRTHLNGVNASVSDQTSDWFALNNVDEVSWSVEGTTPVVEFQNNQVWDAQNNRPNSSTWYAVETVNAAGIYQTNVSTSYGRFVATDGNPVTVRARRRVAADARV